jgi:hypothetical protein
MWNSPGGIRGPILAPVGRVNPPNLLLDENLSPGVALTLHQSISTTLQSYAKPEAVEAAKQRRVLGVLTGERPALPARVDDSGRHVDD